jgi:shikimate dehydrogenase
LREDWKMLGRFGIIGYPLHHSLSPSLFEGIFKILNLEGSYIKFQLKEFEIKPFLESMRIKGFDGMNVTIPYKEIICDYLDFIDPHAEKIKAVNTIHFFNGKIKGYNTDFYGFNKSIEEFTDKIQRATIIGGGGAGRAVLYTISQLECEKMFLIDRNPIRRERIRKDFYFLNNLELMEWREDLFTRAIKESDFVVNATPLGMEGFPDLKFELSFSLEGKIFMDLIYNPPLTSFLSKAKSLGAEIKNGEDMLIFQAMKSLEIWTGIKTKKDDWEKVYNSIAFKKIQEDKND